jgi:hypothetical protein
VRVNDVAGNSWRAVSPGLHTRSGGMFSPGGRGLHSSTFRLNLSALCGIRVQVGIVEGMFKTFRG